MWRRKPLVRFLGGFALWYGLFILPWSGLAVAYGRYFRCLARQAFAEDGDRRSVTFEASPIEGTHSLDTRIVVANREPAVPAALHQAKILDLDSRAIGWVPTAFLLALILATPIPWRRRCVAVFWGGLAIHLFVLLALAMYIFNETGQVGGLSFDAWPAGAKVIADGLEETLITQMGAGFVAPVAIWIAVTFRSNDVKFLVDAFSGSGHGIGNHASSESDRLALHRISRGMGSGGQAAFRPATPRWFSEP